MHAESSSGQFASTAPKSYAYVQDRRARRQAILDSQSRPDFRSRRTAQPKLMARSVRPIPPLLTTLARSVRVFQVPTDTLWGVARIHCQCLFSQPSGGGVRRSWPRKERSLSSMRSVHCLGGLGRRLQSLELGVPERATSPETAYSPGSAVINTHIGLLPAS